MGCGRWIMRIVSSAAKSVACRLLSVVGLAVVGQGLFAQETEVNATQCTQPIYLTFDTGHMGVAQLVSDVLARQKVRATFFLANEPTQTGGFSLDEVWAPWWKALADQGHAFGSHTFDHVYWIGDLSNGRFQMRPSSGPDAKRMREWTSQEYCSELSRVSERFSDMTGRNMLPIFRAPGGKTSPALLQAAASCGYAHAGWSPAGFLGDELSSERYPNAELLERALRSIRTGDILLAHLGIWSRKEPWAPQVLEPLIEGLKKKGFCFATLEAHPGFRDGILARMTTVMPGPSQQNESLNVEQNVSPITDPDSLSVSDLLVPQNQSR